MTRDLQDKGALVRDSAAPHACRVFDVGTRIVDEHVAIRHLDRAKRPRVERRVSGKQSI